MAVEIERKFLVRGDGWKSHVVRSHAIEQGYLALGPGPTVRVRIVDDAEARLTIKGPSDGEGRPEFEYPIPLEDARELLKLRQGLLIAKRRHLLDFSGAEWIIDEFAGRHSGLTLCEVEFKQGVREIAHPDWLGDDVTGDPRYYNAHLAADGEI